jgi:outer membrane protein assembly factor BamE
MACAMPEAKNPGAGSRSRVALVIPLALSACSYLPEIPVPTIPGLSPYRIDIQQGNYLSAEMVAQLKEGMTREQVRFVLGTPLVTDIFHADRWDYVFYRELGNGKKEHRHLSVFFKDDKLVRHVGAETIPSDGLSRPAASAAPVKPAAAQAASAEKK